MQRGFTLIELMMVLAIIAGLAALAGPRIYRQVEDAAERAEQGKIVDRIASLAFESFRSGKARLWRPDVPLAPDEDFLKLPPGWQARPEKAIAINLLGVCSGGRFTLVAPSGYTVSYELKAPYCDDPREVQASGV